MNTFNRYDVMHLRAQRYNCYVYCQPCNNIESAVLARKMYVYIFHFLELHFGYLPKGRVIWTIEYLKPTTLFNGGLDSGRLCFQMFFKMY